MMLKNILLNIYKFYTNSMNTVNYFYTLKKIYKIQTEHNSFIARHKVWRHLATVQPQWYRI